MRRPALFIFSLALLGCFVAGSAQAQATDPKKPRYLPEKVQASKLKDIGWDGKLSLGASASLSSSRKVVGQADGETYTALLQINSGLDYIAGPHEWRNSLKVNEAFARTPQIDEFVKTADVLAIESIYLYKLKSVPWIGPFGRFQFGTSMFPTYDVRAGDTNYIDKESSGNVLPGAAPRLRLAGPFEPINLQETIGVFAKPLKRSDLDVEIKLGFMAKQTLVRGDNTFVVDDDAATGPISGPDGDIAQIEVKRLSNVIQGGPSLGVIVKGNVYAKKITWFVDAEAMIPVLNDKAEGDDRNAVELTNVAISAGLSVKVFSWMSLDYLFRLVREPQLVNSTQVQNNILLTFTYTVFKAAADEKKPAKK